VLAEQRDMLPPVSASEPGREEWAGEKHPDYMRDTEPVPPEEGVSLEDTMAVVKEKMWSLGDAALKGVAEVLVGFGISPTILGYTEEELFEEEELAEGQQQIQKDKVVAKTSYARRSEESMNRRRAEDVAEEEEPQPKDSPSAAGGGWRLGADLIDDEVGEYKKDK